MIHELASSGLCPTEHIVPGIRDIAPKDEDAIATSVAPRTSTISHPRDARFGTSGSDINLPISGGSVTELPATDAWLGAVIGDGTYMG